MLVQKAASSLNAEVGDSEGPADILLAAKIFNVRIESMADDHYAGNGYVMPTNNGFRMVVDDRMPYSRWRFTVAHELGHILFHQLSGGSFRRIIPKMNDSRGKRREEALCDAFARALLISAGKCNALAGKPPSIFGAASMARSLQVSLEAMIRRLLYDEIGWQDSVFYQVKYSGGSVDVVVFRGQNRRATNDLAPPKRVIAKTLLKRNGASIKDALSHIISSFEWVDLNGGKGGWARI